MNRQLSEIGTIPITTSIIESLYPELKSANKKVTWLEKQGVIIRLKRGLYVINPEYSGKALSSELIANHLYAPSYISMSTALRYYGLIPEAVYVHQSMTIKHSRCFQTPVGSSSKVVLRYMKDVGVYLEQDIRMDMDEFYKMDATIFEDYINVGKKADSISTLLKFFRR